MLKIEIWPSFYNAFTFEFKSDEQGTYTLMVIKNAAVPPAAPTEKSAVWHGYAVPASEINTLQQLLLHIRANRYAAGVRVICDGTRINAETPAFSPFHFECSEEGENSEKLIKTLESVCVSYIPDPDFAAELDKLKSNC
jgi:hypothetical protein